MAICVCDKFAVILNNKKVQPMKFGLILFLLGQAYVSWRTFKILPFPIWGKVLVVVLMLMALLSLVWRFVRMFQGISNLQFDTLLYNVGTSWLIVMLYLLLIYLIMDIGVLTRIIPKGFNHDSVKASALVLGAVLALVAFGYVHYNSKKKVELTLTTSKSLPKPLKVVMMSDMHLGYHIDKNEFSGWVDMINAEAPDLILIAGDIVDISLHPVNDQKMEEEFRRFKAPVYACFGNHDHFSNPTDVERFFKKAGIHLLKDSATTVAGINIVGRDDRMNGHRATLHSIMKSVDKSRYTILLDHQPYHLEQAEREGVDFQFSGHTHEGQVWPISLVTGAMYEKDHGCHQRGDTQYYISSGIGIWGGKFRIGTSSEYVVATITSSKKG